MVSSWKFYVVPVRTTPGGPREKVEPKNITLQYLVRIKKRKETKDSKLIGTTRKIGVIGTTIGDLWIPLAAPPCDRVLAMFSSLIPVM